MKRSARSGSMNLIFGLLGSVILLFIIIPIFKMVLLSGPDSLAGALADESVTNSIMLSLTAALAATVLGFVFGVPLAYLLARYEFPGKRLVEGLIDLPIVIPHSAAGIALLFVFGRNFLAGQFFGLFGVSFIDSTAGIIIAMLFVSVPFLIDSAREGFRRVDPRLEKVARTLGASPWQVFVRITAPLSWRAVLGGGIMMWARGISEFGAVIMLTYHPATAPVVIFERFETYGLSYALPVATLLVVICGVLFLLFRLLEGRGADND